MSQDPQSTACRQTDARLEIIDQVRDVCIHCGLCNAHCAFLSGKESPGRLAAAYETDPGPILDMAFHCSLCGLCTVLCPKNLDLRALFLAWREEAMTSGRISLKPYHGILAYEKKGCSPLFSYYHLPRHCDAVFFPGCTLTGTRPDKTLKAYDYLQSRIPHVGMVLDCCTKPSHDLGRSDFFGAMFGELCAYLTSHGISRVVTACPSCHTLFSTRGPLTAVSIYEIMAEDDQEDGLTAFQEDAGESGFRAVIQDPCQARKDHATQRAARTLAKRAGVEQIPLKATGPRTLCCGEGASVGRVRPGLAKAWTLKRKKAAGGHTALTYCAGCVSAHGQGAIHFLDLIFDPVRARKGEAVAARPPITYLNRLRVKQRLKSMPSAHSRVRKFFFGEEKPGVGAGHLAAGLVMAIATVLAGLLIFR